MQHNNYVWVYIAETPLPFFVKCFCSWKVKTFVLKHWQTCWTQTLLSHPRSCGGITGGIWEVSEDLDSAPYPLLGLVLRYTNSPVPLPEGSGVCSWFKGGKLLQPVANLAKEFMDLESLNSCRILEITDGKGLWRLIWTHVPKQDCFVQLILQSFVQTDFEKLLYDIGSQS